MLFFLIGLSGSGKSYWAKHFSAHEGYNAVDVDALIITRSGSSIADIFKEKGELYFRQQEQKIIQEIIDAKNDDEDILIATGGGLPCFEDNINLMLEHGTVIYLEMHPDKLAQRLRSATDRPLLANKSLEELSQLLKQQFNTRKAFYEKATIKVDAANVTSATFASIFTSAKTNK